ncbi:hypothetical protein LTS10_012425 [Elasticomyces elasticus]|nr:hypothetical protein LTS10_012425 [Elasticomyces elasticus]
MSGAHNQAVPTAWLQIMDDIEHVRNDPEYFFRTEEVPMLVDLAGDELEHEGVLRMMLGVRRNEVSQEAEAIVDRLLGRQGISTSSGAQLSINSHITQAVRASGSAPTSRPPQVRQAPPPPPPTRPKGEFMRNRPSPFVRLPSGVDVSMVEINDFFPATLLNPTVILRAVRNGFSREDLARIQHEAVDQFTSFTAPEVITTVNRLQQQISKAGKLEDPNRQGRWQTEEYVKRVGLQNDLTTGAWKQRDQYGSTANARWTDMRLYDIANCVPRRNWPTGNDRLYVTACLEFAVSRPDLNLTTADWDTIMQNHLPTFVLPAAPTAASGHNRDTEAHYRLFG